MTPSYTYIDSTDALVRAMSSCAGRDVVTVDTEFQRTDTYYPEVGLIQVYDGETCFLIDPLPIDSLEPFATLMADNDTIKVLHACSEDLEVFHYSLGCVPGALFDTQIAAAVLGTGFSMSYQNLVEHHLSVVVPKEETRSNWLRRPLSESQKDYAALDVIYLFDVYQQQVTALEAEGRSEWVAEECEQLGNEIAINVPPGEMYLRIKSAARMNGEELNRLRELCAWREETARRLNVPRNRIVDEKSLINICRNPPYSREALARAGLSPKQVRRYEADITECLERAELIHPSDWPAPMPDGGNVDNKRLKVLRQVVNERAEAIGIAPEMLARRRQLEELLRSNGEGNGYQLPSSLSGWRRELIGKQLLEALGDG